MGFGEQVLEYKEFEELKNSRIRGREESALAGTTRWMREPARTFRDLLVWQKAHEFTLLVYQLTSHFPRHEVFGLSCQMQRAAVSIAANIAEGFKRRGKPDKVRFLNIAQSSLEECRYYLILAQDLRYGDVQGATSTLEETSRFLDLYVQRILASSNS